MDADDREPIEREAAHPRARELMTDAFFWDERDEGAPLGSDTGNETLGLYRAFRDEHPEVSALTLLGEVCARWEVLDEHWDDVTEEAVAAAGAEDEFSLLTRDELVLALAFAELLETGRIDPEVQRRAILATMRQELKPLLLPWGDRDRVLERATRLERMRRVLTAATVS